LRWFIWVYLLGLGILFYSFWRCVKLIHDFSLENPGEANSLRRLILGIGIVCGVILLGLYPITALDAAIYVVNARNWVLYGGNPLTVPPEAFPNDPYVHLAGEFINETSPYGPLWQVVSALPVWLGVTGMAGGIAAMKIIQLLAYIGAALLIGWKSSQRSGKFNVSPATALAFFALNPFILLETIGNAHNDMLMIALMILGLILWQRDRWMWAAAALTCAALVKLPALILIPLLGIAALTTEDALRARLVRGLGIAAIFLSLYLLSYRLMGPFPDVFEGVIHSFSRRSFSPAYALYVVTREIEPDAAKAILPNTRYVFVAVYVLIAAALWRKKLNLLEAGFLAYLAQIFLSNAFRIWYPLWLVPFAALDLRSRTFWRTFLFGLAAELSILSYYVLWRWHLRFWDWGLTGPLAPYWDYFKIMTPFTVSWTFTLPFLGDLIGRIKDQDKYRDSLWV
jgi:hypothetical protein